MFGTPWIRSTSFCLGIALWSLAGCGKPGDGIGPVSPGIRHTEPPAGSLEAVVAEVHAEPAQSECDAQIRPVQIQVAKALDLRKFELEKYVASLPPSPDWRRVRLGPTVARERVVPRAGRPGWQRFTDRWSDVATAFQQANARTDIRDWVRLNTMFRSMIVDDYDRVVRGLNFGIGAESESKIREVQRKIDLCLAIRGCRWPSFDDLDLEFLESVEWYRFYLSELRRVIEIDDRREVLRRFTARLKWDLTRYNMLPEADAVRDPGAPETLRVTLDLGDLVGASTQIRDTIQAIWKTQGKDVRVQFQSRGWVGAPVTAFKFLLEDFPGGRSFVRYRDRTIHVYPDVRLRTLAHEFGHVLGFPDRYFTRWNDATCEITTETDELDLMSDSETGGVTSRMWTQLDGSYRN